MDDSLEQPDAKPTNTVSESAEDVEQGSDEEGDVVLDWSKLLPSSARPVIPRRGEKEFEPHAGGGSGLQVHILDRSRSAMLDALRAQRTISSKGVSYAVWHPDLARAHVTVSRGTHFSSMGHSVPRPTVVDGTEKLHKRMELLPEEALYLIERGSLYCWKETDRTILEEKGLEDVQGSPMSVQQAFAEMIGKENLTLERYQVFAYLKRLGYVVTRAEAPSHFYPLPPAFDLRPLALKNGAPAPFILRMQTMFSSVFSRIWQPRFDWWHPFRIPRWSLSTNFYYGSLFRGLRFLRVGHSVPLLSIESASAASQPSPYQIFYNIHKPATPFRKSAPCLPDYQVVVVDARKTPMPSLKELTDLFDVSPELPPPVPRQRNPQNRIPSKPPQKTVSETTLFQRLWGWLRPSTVEVTPAPRRAHPFMVMKAGKKTVVVAVVDSGSVGFFRFGQGAFEDWPLQT